MEFKEAIWEEWEEWENDYSVAKMAFGVQLIVVKGEGTWLWQMGNPSSVFKQGRVKDEGVAKKKAEHAFHLYVLENLDMCTE